MRTSLLPPDILFLRNCLRRYYYEQFGSISIPDQIQRREFGYVKPGMGMIRHIQISDKSALRAMLMQETPMEVYASNATYLFPDLPMAEKEWQQADMIFDIDSKDLKLECRPSHTVHICDVCGTTLSDTDCRICGTRRVNPVSLPCNNCIDHAKIETERLLDMLGDDFGIKSGVEVYFSGNEGFHVHVPDTAFSKLGSNERADIVDYLMFQGITPETLGMRRNQTRTKDLPVYSESGWRGRFAQRMFGKRRTKKDATALISAGYDSFAKLLPELKLGVRVDPNVTVDVHRIFRLPGTLNGKSAMPKTRCDIQTFDMRSVPLLSGDDTPVRACCPVSFELGGQKFGPYKGEYVTVPTYAAAYMICKGMAHALT